MRRSGWKTLATTMLALGALLLLAPEVIQRRIQSVWDTNDPSNYARLAIWKAGVGMVREHPLGGRGPLRVSKVFYEYHPYPEDRKRSGFFPVHLHNNLLQLLRSRGSPLCFVLALAHAEAGLGSLANVSQSGYGRKRSVCFGYRLCRRGLSLFGRTFRVQFRRLGSVDGFPVPEPRRHTPFNGNNRVGRRGGSPSPCARYVLSPALLGDCCPPTRYRGWYDTESCWPLSVPPAVAGGWRLDASGRDEIARG